MHTTYIRTTMAAALILVALAAQASAQSASTVSDRIRDAMTAQEVGWTLDTNTLEDTKVFHHWKNRAESILIEYREHASNADATTWLEEVPGSISAPGGQLVTGVGDDARIWVGASTDGSATIYFRSGKGTAQVTAPSRTITIRIAQLVAAQIYP
jgi:hypothetical protein